jgi:hypothetical protein
MRAGRLGGTSMWLDRRRSKEGGAQTAPSRGSFAVTDERTMRRPPYRVARGT